MSVRPNADQRVIGQILLRFTEKAAPGQAEPA